MKEYRIHFEPIIFDTAIDVKAKNKKNAAEKTIAIIITNVKKIFKGDSIEIEQIKKMKN